MKFTKATMEILREALSEKCDNADVNDVNRWNALQKASEELEASNDRN